VPPGVFNHTSYARCILLDASGGRCNQAGELNRICRLQGTALLLGRHDLAFDNERHETLLIKRKGLEAVNRIPVEYMPAKVLLGALNLSDLDSVREFAGGNRVTPTSERSGQGRYAWLPL
jgi:hypothetical protein